MNFLHGIIDAVPSVFNISAVPKIIKEVRDEANDIEFYLSNECPMKIKYDLGDNSSLIFYIAPKLADD